MLYQGKLVQEYKSPLFISLPCFRFGLINLQEVLEKLLAASVCQPQAPESLCSNFSMSLSVTTAGVGKSGCFNCASIQ